MAERVTQGQTLRELAAVVVLVQLAQVLLVIMAALAVKAHLIQFLELLLFMVQAAAAVVKEAVFQLRLEELTLVTVVVMLVTLQMEL
jgi:hypothetical protein